MSLASFQDTWFREVYSSSPIDSRREIHRSHHYASLTDALAQTYPITIALVGNDYFKQLARQYIDTYKLSTPAVDSYGEQFPDLAARLSPLVYLSDVMRAEWYIDCLKHHQPDSPDLSGLANCANADRLRLKVKNARLIKSQYAIASLINSINDGTLGELDIETPEHCVIYGDGCIKKISSSEYEAFLQLIDGAELHQLDHDSLGSQWVVEQIQQNIIDEVLSYEQ